MRRKLIITLIFAALLLVGCSNHQNTSEPRPLAIDVQKAQDIAVAHAGIKEPAQSLKVHLENDDGVKSYDVEFSKDGVEYEVEIDANSGEVISFDKDVKAPAKTTVKNSEKQITVEEAKQIALSHASLTSAQFERTELDRDNGIYTYEIEFYADGYEYEYEISREDGKILSHKKEQEYKAPAKTSGALSEKQITAEEAKQIAFSHAAVSSARFDRTELDRENGINCYEIEFYADGIEYSYKIDQSSGTIIEHEIDLD